jgi:hypothetical protein
MADNEPVKRNPNTGVTLPTDRVVDGGNPAPEETETVPGLKRDQPSPPTRKICIVGTTPSRMMAPLDDPTWEIWTIGPGGKNAHRWDRLFEVHGNGSWPDGFREYLEELAAIEPPKIIYTEDVMPMWPAHVQVNKAMLFEKYGRMFFSSQISYALAIAIEEGATDLAIYGIDLESGEEYRSQFMGAKFFLHLARLAGISITMPKGCGLLRDPAAYPDSWETHLGNTLLSKIEYLEGKHNQMTVQHGQLSADINQISGELNAFRFLRDLYVTHGEDPNHHFPEKTREPETNEMLKQVIGMLRDGGK